MKLCPRLGLPCLATALTLALVLPLLAPGASVAHAQEAPATKQAKPVLPRPSVAAPAARTAKVLGQAGPRRTNQGTAGQKAAAPGSTRPAQAAGKPVPGKSPAAAQPAGEDQSFLYSDYSKAPPVSAGAPDYVTSGSSHFNQPWFMSIYDKLGNWPPP